MIRHAPYCITTLDSRKKKTLIHCCIYKKYRFSLFFKRTSRPRQINIPWIFTKCRRETRAFRPRVRILILRNECEANNKRRLVPKKMMHVGFAPRAVFCFAYCKFELRQLCAKYFKFVFLSVLMASFCVMELWNTRVMILKDRMVI